MSFDYSATLISVKKTLLNFGRSITLTRKTVSAYDPSAGAATVVETSQSATGLVLDHGDRNIDGVLIKLGDKQLLLSPTDITAPRVGDTATVGTDEYAIVSVKTLDPGGIPVLYECNIRS